jgi:protein TonB
VALYAWSDRRFADAPPSETRVPDGPRKWLTGATLSVSLHAGVILSLLLVAGAPPGRSQRSDGPSTFAVYMLPAEAAANPPAQPDGKPVVDEPRSETGLPAARATLSSAPRSVAAAMGSVASSEQSVMRPSADNRMLMARYQEMLQAHIKRFQLYPDAARIDRIEGSVEIGFSVGRDGSLRDLWIERSSGNAALDEGALATLRRAAPLPAVPDALPEEIGVSMPVAFSLSSPA